MARIRSIHPGIFTDEGFMSLSMEARMLIIGVWTEAFDDGIFAWKPLTFKARIFPVDNVDIGDLLCELIGENFIKKFQVDGRDFGAIRNFRKFQRPKKPNSSGVLPAEYRTYVGLTGDSSPPVPNQFPTSSEKSPQMEDGGDKMEDGGCNKTLDQKPDFEQEFDQAFWPAYPRKVGKGAARKALISARKKADLATIVAGAQRYKAERDGQDENFTVHASRWLNEERWLDESGPRGNLKTSGTVRTDSPEFMNMLAGIGNVANIDDETNFWKTIEGTAGQNAGSIGHGGTVGAAVPDVPRVC